MPVFKHTMHGLIAPFSLKEDQIRTKIEIVVKVKKGCYPCYLSITLLPLQGKGVVQHTRSVIVCGKHKNVMRSCGRGEDIGAAKPLLHYTREFVALYPRTAARGDI